jgi:hypothetical membrane protein
MLAISITVIAAAYLFVGLVFLAPRKIGYNHLSHTISELGESGAPDQRLVAFGLFLPIGLALLCVALLVRAGTPATAALALCIAVGYIGAAMFPCDRGSPAVGTFRQGVHNLAGAVEYFGGGLALMVLAEGFGQPFKAAGFGVFAAAIALTVLPSDSFRGAIQRLAEFGLFGGVALGVWRASF